VPGRGGGPGGEEPAGRGRVPLLGHQHVDDLTVLVDGSVQVPPPAGDLDVGLIDEQRSPVACRSGRATSTNNGANAAPTDTRSQREVLLATGRLPTDKARHRQLLHYVRQWPRRTWAVEGAHGVGRPLAARLLADGEAVVDVPAKLAATVKVRNDLPDWPWVCCVRRAGGRGGQARLRGWAGASTSSSRWSCDLRFFQTRRLPIPR
jgi:hypothetical protein